MSDGIFPWSHFRAPVVKKQRILEVFGPLTRRKIERGPREVTMHQKVDVLIFYFFNVCPKRAVLTLENVSSCLTFSPLSSLPSL
jgi:hypothetical protein